MGKGLFDKELEEALTGLKTGEEKTVVLSNGSVHVKILSVKRRILPEFSDDTVASWGIEGVNSLSSLKETLKEEARREYLEDLKESLAVSIMEETNSRSTFSLDPEEVKEEEMYGEKMAADMLKSAGLDPDTADDEAVKSVSGRTRKEHFAYLRQISVDSLKSSAIGSVLMNRDKKTLTAADYEKAVEESAEGLGITKDEVKKSLMSYSRFLRSRAADYYFDTLIDYSKKYLSKENET